MINFNVGDKLVCINELTAFKSCFILYNKYEINKIETNEYDELVYYIDGENYYDSIEFYYESLIEYFNVQNIERRTKLEKLSNIF